MKLGKITSLDPRVSDLGMKRLRASEIPHAGPDAELLGAAAMIPDKCGHGRKWEEDCPQCASVWRHERIADLVKQANKYGFVLVPKDQAP